ncbi:MAG: transglycosylase domain-containing protein [Blastocatellia bacterium]
MSIEQPISRKELRERLLRAGYQQSETGQPEREADPLSSGSFVFNGDTAELRTNEFARPGSLPKTVKIRFSKPAGSGERILAIEDAATGQELKSADLAPELITVDGVTMMHPRSQARFDDFPPALVKALLSIEDRHFFSHRGIDVKAVCRAMWENWRHGEIREGGSTITQQLIKTSFLTPERTYERKFTEALMAVAIERRLSKVEIFTIYADRVYLGQSGLTGVYGFKQAARVFFDKDLSELSLAESALIAGLAQAPNRYSPYLNPDAALGRRNTVLDAMVETSEISAAEAEAAKSEKLEVLPPAQPDESAAQHFVDYLKRELTGRKISEKDQPNLKIQTTLDLDLQQAANSAVKNHLKKLDRVFGPRASGAKTKDDPHKTALAEAALIAIDPRTGEILAMVGGRDYASSQLNRVTDARRQPGSVFKPIVYAAALAQGMSPETIFDDTPHEFIFGRDIYRPQNYGGGFSNRLVTLREGIVRSLNVVAVDAAMRVGLPKVADIAQKMGLPRPEAYPSMALGAFEATPFEIAEAYSTFANDGVSVAPFGIKSVTSATAPGVQNTGTKTRVLNSSTAYIVTETLADVINHGTASQVRAMGYHGPAAGKTGSSRDAWFAGYTPNMLVVVWVGFDDHRDLKMTGGGAAVPIWTDFVKRALAARPDLKAREFTPPTGSELVEIDTETGMLASENCPSRKSVVIDISKMPPYCFKHQTIRATEATGARIGRKKYSVLAGNPRQRSARKVNQAPDTDSARDPYLKPMSDGVELLPRLQPLTTRRQFEMAPKGRPFRVVGPILPGSTSQKPETRKEEPPRRDYR